MTDRILVPHGNRWIRIHREDADPEHRFTSYQLAAVFFGNSPVR